MSRPEFLPEFLSRDDVSGALQQKSQYVKGLLLDSYSNPVLAQFGRTEIDFKKSKS